MAQENTGKNLPTQAHVLLVDDEVSVLDISTFILQQNGYAVSMASSGQAALGLLNGSANSSQPVDLVITDLTMPAMSGVDFIREMRKRAFSMPVVVATGSIDSYPENEIQNIRADHILVKPFKPDHLTDCVKTILARHVGSQVATCPATGRRGKPADLPCRSAPAEAGARGATVARAEDDAAEVLPGGEVTGRTGTYG